MAAPRDRATSATLTPAARPHLFEGVREGGLWAVVAANSFARPGGNDRCGRAGASALRALRRLRWLRASPPLFSTGTRVHRGVAGDKPLPRRRFRAIFVVPASAA